MINIIGLVVSIVGTILSMVSICLSYRWWKKTYKEVKFLQTKRKLYSTKLSDKLAFVKIRDLTTTLLDIDPDFNGFGFANNANITQDTITALVNCIVNIKYKFEKKEFGK